MWNQGFVGYEVYVGPGKYDPIDKSSFGKAPCLVRYVLY